MIITLHYQDKNKTLNAVDLSDLKEQIILSFYFNHLKASETKLQAMELTARDVGLSYESIKKIVYDYQKEG